MSIQPIKVPDIGNAANVEIIEIPIKVGDTVEIDDTLITLESDKASMDIPSPVAGTIKKLHIKLGDKVSAGSLIVDIETAAETAPQKEEPVKKAEAMPVKEAPKAEVVQETTSEIPDSDDYASPSVRRIARELNLDLAAIAGSGRKGRITKEDLEHYVKKGMSQTSGGMGLPQAPVVDFSQFGETETQPLNRIKRLTGENLQRNWLLVPHVTQFDEADITELEAFRQAEKMTAEKQGLKLTPLTFIMKAVVKALKQFPTFNSSLSPAGDALILKKYFHIGVAVDTPNGLVVPVIRDVDKKSIFDLAKELADISKKAREKGLTANDMQGSCFTISSLGGIGGTAFTPIVNLPDVAILGVSKSTMKPVYVDGQFVPRLMLPLSLSYDHRVIDGAEGARFITYLSAQLADIRRLIL